MSLPSTKLGPPPEVDDPRFIEWMALFWSYVRNSTSGVTGIAQGGTGLSTLGAAYQLLGVNAAANGLEYKPITGTGGSNVMMSASPTTTGLFTASAVNISGILTLTGSSPILQMGSAAISTGVAGIEVGSGRTGAGDSYIDLTGDATFTDYGARFIRNSGSTGGSSLISRGTGTFSILTIENGPVTIGVNSVTVVTINSSGMNAVLGATTPAAATVTTLFASGHVTLEGVTSTGATGTGKIVFDTSPSLVTPALGTPTALVGTNITGTAAGLTAGSVTTNANLTGPITSVGNATSIASQTGTGTTFVMSASPTISGHPTIEGVTSTGATGTGKFVFDTGATMGAFTLSGTVSGSGQNLNNIIIGAVTPLAGSFTTGAFSSTITGQNLLSIGMADDTTQAKFNAATGRIRVAGYVASVNAGAAIDSVNAAENAFLPMTLRSSALYGNISGSTVTATTSTGFAITGTLGVTGTTTAAALNGTTISASGQFNSTILDSNAASDLLLKRNGTTGITIGAASLVTLAGHLSVESVTSTGATGTGKIVFDTSPVLVTPALGTPSALVGTNITGTASSLTAGAVTTNANLTGPITSVGNATSIASQTGTGTKFVVDTSPTLVTPLLGTPTSGNLTNCTIESGTWTPSLTGWTNVGSPTLTGTYAKIGKMVTIHFVIVPGTTVSSVAGTSYVSGLPYAPASAGAVAWADTTANISFGIGSLSTAGGGRLYAPGVSANTDTFACTITYVST